MATDVAELVDGLGVGPVHVVGHDVGGWVAYALARLRPELARTMVIMETLLPGIEPADAPPVEVPLWHGGFHMVPELPETLVHGREAAYFRYFFDIGTAAEYVVTDAEIEHYVAAYGDLAHLHAAFEMYRAIPENAAFNDAHRTPVDVPLLLVGGEQVFGPGMPLLAKHLRAEYGWTDVDAAIVEGARHYLPEERPAEIAELIERHARARRTLVMNDALPEVVSEQEWQKAFDAMLVKEKELTRARDELAAARRRMPMVAVEKDYRFVGPDGEVGLLDLFDGPQATRRLPLLLRARRRQLAALGLPGVLVLHRPRARPRARQRPRHDVRARLTRRPGQDRRA